MQETRQRPWVAIFALMVVLTFVCYAALAQGPTPKPTPAERDTAKKTSEPADPKAAEAEPDAWHREELTGDWGGARTRWKEKGFEFEFKFTNFYQGVVDGGVRQDQSYLGKIQTVAKFDLGKLAGWKFWSAEVRTETRFGGALLTGTGGINPVNTAAIIPASSGTVFSITAVNFTRLIPIDLKKGNLFAVSFGRFNLVELIDEDFFAGAGIERFMNVAPVGPLTVVREVPLITNGASFAYVKGGVPRFTLAVLDPNDHSLDPGLSDLFKDGVTFAPTFHFPVKYFGKTAKHSIGGAITTKKYTPFDSLRQVIIPGPAINPVEPVRGSWSIAYTFRQYIVERGPRDGWGFFSQLSIANKRTSPITRFVNFGIGGNGLFKARRTDEFGMSYAYSDLSSILKKNIDFLNFGGRPPQPEHQLEVFYNLHITPWLRLTGDLQVVRGVRPTVNRAVIPGARLEMIF
jgi:porin